MSLRDRKGFGLIILVALTALSGILVASTSLFFASMMRQAQMRIDKTKAQYLAQAGVMQALHNYLASGTNENNRRYGALNATVTGNQIFKTGSQANFAYFSFTGPAAQWQTVAAFERFRRWSVRNIHSTDAIRITGVRVSWTPAGGTLRSVSLSNQTTGITTVVVAPGSYANGAAVPIASYAIPSGHQLGGNNTYFEWNTPIPSPTRLTVQWTFEDDSATKDSLTHEVLCWNGSKAAGGCAESAGGPSCVNTFSITATGQVNQASLKTLETVRAVVSTTPSGGDNPEIIDWDDLDKNIP